MIDIGDEILIRLLQGEDLRSILEGMADASHLKVINFKDDDSIIPELRDDIIKFFPRAKYLKSIVLDVGEVDKRIYDAILDKSRELEGVVTNDPNIVLSFRYFRRTRGNDILKFAFYENGSTRRMIVKARDLYNILRKVDNLTMV